MQKGRINPLFGRQAILNTDIDKTGTDVKICRAIARSKSNELTVKEIITIIGPKSNSIYENIHTLVSQSGETWDVRYLFCSTLINDLIKKKNNNENEEIDRTGAQSRLDEEIDKIAHKLESLYYDKYSERVKLVSHIESSDDAHKNIITFESNESACAKIILDKSAEKIKDSAILTIGDRNIPLVWKHKEHKLYFKPRKSTSKVKGELDYLRCITSDLGLRKISEYNKKITKLSNSKYTMDERKERLMHNYQSKIRKIYDDIHYKKLTMTTKSLLLYVSKENDYTEFNKSVECLSDSETDLIHEKVMVREFNEFGEESNVIYHPFTFKRDFPYLSNYTLAKDHLPLNFVPGLLERIALELKDKLQDMNGEEINYTITNRFLEGIRKYISANNRIDKNALQHIDDYLREINVYIEYIDLRDNETRKREENWKSIYDKENNLRQILLRHIEKGLNRKEEIIIIHEQIKQAKVLWDSERHILELIENKFGERYIVTPTSLIKKSKARKLRTLLRGKPTPQKARSLLIEKGSIPEGCINYEFLTRLGFCINITRLDYTSPFVTEIKRNRPAHEWKLYDYLPPLSFK
jgi:hypothetical protein